MKQYNFIQTRAGDFFNYDDIENNDFNIEDVAHSLANQCRWSGHTKFFYPVIQHLLLADQIAMEEGLSYELQYEALMHDTPEAFVIDLPRPLKRLCPDYCKINERVENVMADRFSYPATMSPEVKEIDDRLLITEYHQLIDTHDRKRFRNTNLPDFNLEPYDIKIAPFYNEESFKAAQRVLVENFLAEFMFLRSVIGLD